MPAQLILEMTADESKVFNSQKRLIAQQEKMIGKLKGIKSQSDKAGRSMKQGFGQTAIGQLKTFAFGMVGIQKATQLATEAFTKAAEARQRFAQAGKTAAPAFAQAAQLASTQAEFGGFTSRIRKLSSRSGLSVEQAEPAFFALLSASLGGQANEAALGQGVRSRLFAPQNIQSLISGSGKFAETFPQSLESIFSRGLVASSVAQANVPSLLGAAGQNAALANTMGIGQNELLAATSLVSRTSGVDIARTQIKSLLTGISEGKTGVDTKGKTLEEVVRGVSGRNLDLQGLREALGGKSEAVQGFLSLQGRLSARGGVPSLAGLTGQIRQAKGTFGVRSQFAERDPLIRAGLESERLKVKETLEADLVGALRNQRESLETLQRTQRRRAGVSEFRLGVRGVFQRLTGVADDEKVLRAFVSASQGKQVSPESRNLLDATETLLKAVAELRQSRKEGRAPSAEATEVIRAQQARASQQGE